MKRQVFVPLSKLIDGKVPGKALTLAASMRLPIEVGTGENERCTEIDVVEVPEKISLDIKAFVNEGFIQVIKYTNEFIDFNAGIECVVITPSKQSITLKPSIKERHLAIFRHRFYEHGKHDVLMFINNDNGNTHLNMGEFEVT